MTAALRKQESDDEDSHDEGQNPNVLDLSKVCHPCKHHTYKVLIVGNGRTPSCWRRCRARSAI